MTAPASLGEITKAAQAVQLDVFGALHEGAETVLLLGPHEPGFWAVFSSAPEAGDGAPDPMDRWSKRVIAPLAQQFGGTALFPSDGPPYAPFFSWAMHSGRAWQSPVTLLVHDRAGLWVSFRGALRLPYLLDLPATPTPPCTTCTAPCQTACPVGALNGDGYDVARCHAHLDTKEGKDCLSQGCLVRSVCPVSQTYGRLAEQSHFHMKAFHPT